MRDSAPFMRELPPGLLPLCNSNELVEAGQAVPFDVVYAGQTCRAFAVRYKGLPHAYLNRCTHVAMELDWQPNQFLTPLVNGWCVPVMVQPMCPTPARVRVDLAETGSSKLIFQKMTPSFTGTVLTTLNR